MKKRLWQLLERENGRQLDEDVTASAIVAAWVTAFVSATLALLIGPSSQQSLTVARAYQLGLLALMLFACVFLMLFLVGYGRYRTERTCWEYLLSLKRIPLSHWTIPLPLHEHIHTAFVLAKWPLALFGRRFLPHQRPKRKAPILLFQQAPLLLAP